MDALYRKLYQTYSKNRSEYAEQCKDIRNDIQKHQDYFSKHQHDSRHLIPYPELDDPEFNKKISQKKEFFITKSDLPDLNQSFDEIADSKCSVSNFILTQNQKFVHNFLNPLTPYNSLILFHKTGVGKTVSAIIVAETYYQIYQKKVLVVMSHKLFENFKKQIFDVAKYNLSTDDSQQCTGNLYPDMLIDKEQLKQLPFKERDQEIMKRVNKIINTRYEFVGFIQLANRIENLQNIADEKKRGLTPEQRRRKLEIVARKINQEYGNRLIIVDEVHNLRVAGNSRDKKLSSDRFLDLIKATSGVKLLLLTATPMFNNATEFIWIVNLLLSNDKRTLMQNNEIFDGNGHLKKGAESQIVRKTRGYVSYMRGENPFTFPFRLYPSINRNTSVLDRKKYRIDLDLIGCQMSTYQKKIYQYFLGDDIKITNNYQDLDDYDENSQETDKNNLQIVIQISNICYPSKELNRDSTRKEWRKAYGDLGWKNNFEQSGNKWKYRDKTRQFLKYDSISELSPKIKGILDSIISSTGIVLVHSRYYKSGINPIIIALEHIGFMNYQHDNFSWEIDVDNRFGIKNKKWKYIALSGDPESKAKMDRLINDSRRDSNKNGDEIKVILITSVASEGIDFKNIREVHLLEPWFNLNKTEQVIGRAIRNCSHIALPKEKRNVTVYQWTNVTADFDTIDLQLYRESERKQKIIYQIEKILQKNSIDCYLNKNILDFSTSKLNKDFDISTSQDQVVANFKIGDTDNLVVSCGDDDWSLDGIKHPDDTTTFSKFFIKDDIDLLKRKISRLYRDKIIYNFKEIKDVLNCDSELLAFSLDEMLKERYRLDNATLKWGRLIYRSNLYIFQPETLNDVSLTIDQRKDIDNLGGRIKDKFRLKASDVNDKYVEPLDNEVYKTVEIKFYKYYNWIAQVVHPHVTSMFNQLFQTIGEEKFNRLFNLFKESNLSDLSITTENSFDLQKIEDILGKNQETFSKVSSKVSTSEFLQLFINHKFKRLSGRNIDNLSQYVIDSIVDMLKLEEFIELVAIVKHEENDKTMITGNLSGMLRTSIRDIFVDSDHKCFWCYIDQKYYIYKDSKYHEILSWERINMESDISKFEQKWAPTHPNDAVGYVLWDSSKKKTVFKIKKTLKLPGSVCQQSSAYSVDDIKNLIIRYFPGLILQSGSTIYDDFKIKVETLCYIYELVLRTLPERVNAGIDKLGPIFLRPLLLNSKLNRKK